MWLQPRPPVWLQAEKLEEEAAGMAEDALSLSEDAETPLSLKVRGGNCSDCSDGSNVQ